MTKLECALKYQEMGYSVIPINPNKKPPPGFLWKKYQTEKASKEQIKKWDQEYPDANIGICTGKISGFDVIDIDTKAAHEVFQGMIPDTLETPIVKTPNGWHYYFLTDGGLKTKANAMDNIDIRSDGGYIVTPPAIGENKKEYSWLPGFSIHETPFSNIPENLLVNLKTPGNRSSFFSPQEKTHVGFEKKAKVNRLQVNSSTSFKNTSNNYNNIYKSKSNAPILLDKTDAEVDPQENKRNNGKHDGNNGITKCNKRNIAFEKGTRDESIFHIAHCLCKGGMGHDDALFVLNLIASQCDPPFPESEVKIKIASAFNRGTDKVENLTQKIRDWIKEADGKFNNQLLYNDFQFSHADEKKKTRVVLGRLVKEGLIERTGTQAGQYRVVNNDVDRMDFLNIVIETTDVWLPFGLNKLAEIMPGNIILVAGEPNSGKTAFLLNTIRYNMEKFNIHYFNSEMGGGELGKRLSKFDDLPVSDWRFKAYERSSNFADVLRTGKNTINVIDFLEIHDNFYEVGGMLAEIHEKLDGAIAIVALQKNKGTDTGLGGFRSIEKPRLVLAMSPNVIKITKAKNWATDNNPNGLERDFKLRAGCKFTTGEHWYKQENGLKTKAF